MPSGAHVVCWTCRKRPSSPSTGCLSGPRRLVTSMKPLNKPKKLLDRCRCVCDVSVLHAGLLCDSLACCGVSCTCQHIVHAPTSLPACWQGSCIVVATVLLFSVHVSQQPCADSLLCCWCCRTRWLTLWWLLILHPRPSSRGRHVHMCATGLSTIGFRRISLMHCFLWVAL